MVNSSSDALRAGALPADAQAPVVRPVRAESVASAWVLPEFSAAKAAAPKAASALDAAEAERLRALARAEGFAEGQSAGRAAGFAEGQAAGLAAAADETERLQQRLRGWLRELAAPLAAVDEEVSQQISQLALQVARAMIYRELTLAPEDIAAVAREAMAALPVAVRAVALRCHPQDAAALEAALGARELLVQGESTIDIQPDATVVAGGLWVESRTPGLPSRIDASLQSRWAALSVRLLNTRVPGPAEPMPDAADEVALPMSDGAGEVTP